MNIDELNFENVSEDDDVIQDNSGWATQDDFNSNSDDSDGSEEDEGESNEGGEELKSSQEFIDNFGDKSGLEAYLSTKGISDIHSIKFEGENNEVQNVDWNDLTEEERYNILSQLDESLQLDDNETDLLNRIRLSGMSVANYLDSIRQQGYNQAQQDAANREDGAQEYQYTVDDLSDDDLFMADLQTKVEDITEEELEQALESAKANESLYTRQINALREEYRRLEDSRNEREAAIKAQQEQQYSDAIQNSISEFNSIGQLDVAMESEDAEELASFILGSDANGENYFERALKDPDTRVRLAWFALHGEDILNSISEYYNNQITNTARYNYNKGLEDAKKGGGKPSVAIRPRKQRTSNAVKSLDDFEY